MAFRKRRIRGFTPAVHQVHARGGNGIRLVIDLNRELIGGILQRPWLKVGLVTLNGELFETEFEEHLRAPINIAV